MGSQLPSKFRIGAFALWLCACACAYAANPVMPGADPHAIVVGDAVWVYPTWNDGKGERFFAFSSTNLLNWQRHGPVLDFRDLRWIEEDGQKVHHAWAPSVLRRDGKYYFYYSVGPQNPTPSRIGVAMGDAPEGPFRDSGKPLLTGGNGFEAIDPMVFADPQSGKCYLYAGGSAGAKLRVFELNPDLVSFAREISVETPPEFTEGVFMHYYDGRYYLSYSHGSYRHSSYSVHCATADSPTGPWAYRGVILSSDATRKGPGHHSFIRNPLNGDWLIFYHRWENQTGDGPYRGSRQVCIDTVEYDANGLIKPIAMTGGNSTLRPGAARPDLPVITLTNAGTVITQSCQVIIPKGLVLRDTNDQGVIIVGASDIQIEFASGSVLRGSPSDTRPDEYGGYGIRLNGHHGITIRGARISGFWCGLWATKANGLLLEDIDASDNRRAFLRSTPVAEDGGDWLFGHNNDDHEWLKQYAAAIYIEDSANIIVRGSKVWHGQNALCLDRVTAALVFDNDFSFNSGWGIAMWRCSQCTISRNAIDFCVRGYSHGVYNRGQDSAGLFVFEQNNENVFAENSVTHGGDGFFGFAGREAIAETGDHPVEWYKRRGNTDNLLIGNDFSYAPAHGIENTFSFGNKYLNNRIVGNAICGVWAGYSRETLIAGNEFAGNGEMGYGLERGGVNIDHGGDNQILHNFFITNKCGVHLWGGLNPDFEKRGWAKANGIASTGSVIAGNTFNGDTLAYHFRGPGEVVIGTNTLIGVSREIVADTNYNVVRNNLLVGDPAKMQEHFVFGHKRPVGARPELRGRENIIMTEWGPWDHLSPLVRLVNSTGGTAVYEILKVSQGDLRIETDGAQVRGVLTPTPGKPNEFRVTVSAVEPGVRPYTLKISAAGKPLSEVKGALLATKWQATFFKWPADVDPRKNLDGYRKLAEGPTAVLAQLEQLSLNYGMRGPSELGISERVTAAKFGQDHFAMVARARLPLSKGTWEFATLSDDGVRVTVDGKPVIENWAWHGPTRDSGTLELASDKTVSIEVEHFQIDGYAVLEFSLAQKQPPASTK